MNPVSTEGVVLKSRKYKENSHIVQIYTRQLGKQSYLVHAPQSKRARFRASYLLPLSLLDLEVSHRPLRELGEIADARPRGLFPSISAHPVKASLAFFIADVVSATQLQGERDDMLFEYLTTVIQSLDATNDGLADFHCRFLLDYTRLMGFDPEPPDDNDYRRSLSPEHRRLYAAGARGASLTRSERRVWVSLYLGYLRHELPFMGDINSLEVLNGLLN